MPMQWLFRPNEIGGIPYPTKNAEFPSSSIPVPGKTAKWDFGFSLFTIRIGASKKPSFVIVTTTEVFYNIQKFARICLNHH